MKSDKIQTVVGVKKPAAVCIFMRLICEDITNDCEFTLCIQDVLFDNINSI